jgi:hypothetical protein
MSQVDLYLDAAERANTRRSYASAIQHFEIEWGGLLPATIDSIARYLAAYAESLSLNTLKHRLAALSRWHQDHGFPDPTKAPKIRQLLKGIRTLHPAQEKRAKPLELEILNSVADWLTSATAQRQSPGGFGQCPATHPGSSPGSPRFLARVPLRRTGQPSHRIHRDQARRGADLFLAAQQGGSQPGRPKLLLPSAVPAVPGRGSRRLAGFVQTDGGSAIPQD